MFQRLSDFLKKFFIYLFFFRYIMISESNRELRGIHSENRCHYETCDPMIYLIRYPMKNVPKSKHGLSC